MNERIKKLAEQAGFSFRVDNATDDEIIRILKNADRVEKFAKLIVRECAWAADFAEDTSPGEYVKKHFGVE